MLFIINLLAGSNLLVLLCEDSVSSECCIKFKFGIPSTSLKETQHTTKTKNANKIFDIFQNELISLSYEKSMLWLMLK